MNEIFRKGQEEASNFSNSCGCSNEMSNAYGRDDFDSQFDMEDAVVIAKNSTSTNTTNTSTTNTNVAISLPISVVIQNQGFQTDGNYTFPFSAYVADQYGKEKYFAQGTVVKGQTKSDGVYFIEANRNFVDVQQTPVYRVNSLQRGGTIPASTVINYAPVALGTTKAYRFFKTAIVLNERTMNDKQFLKDTPFSGYQTKKDGQDFIYLQESTNLGGGQIVADPFYIPLWFVKEASGTRALADDPDSIVDFTTSGTNIMTYDKLRVSKFYNPTAAELVHMQLHAQLKVVFDQIQRYMGDILMLELPAVGYNEFNLGDLIFVRGGVEYAWIGTKLRIYPNPNETFSIVITNTQSPLPSGVSVDWSSGDAYYIQKNLVQNLLLNLRIGQTRQNDVAVTYAVQGANQSANDWNKQVAQAGVQAIQNANTQATKDAFEIDLQRTFAEKGRQDQAIRQEIDFQSVQEQAKYEDIRRLLDNAQQQRQTINQTVLNSNSISKLSSDANNTMSQLQKAIEDGKARQKAALDARNAKLNAPVNPAEKIQTGMSAAGKAYFASGQQAGGADAILDFAKNTQGSNGRFDSTDPSGLLTDEQFISQTPSNQQEANTNPTQTSKEPAKSSKTWIWVTVVIVVLAVAGGAGYWYWKKQQG